MGKEGKYMFGGLVRPVLSAPARFVFVVGAVLLAALLGPATPGHGGALPAVSHNAVPGCGPGAPGSNVLPTAVPLRDVRAFIVPAVTAKAAVVVDAETGRVLYGLDEHARHYPASTTKIMTAILALENRPLDEMVVAQSDGMRMSAAGSSVMGLAPGVQISIRDLLYGLMLPSGNDAALDLARAVDGGSVDAFVARMNAKAAELRLQNTHFRNPHGLDARGHYSSAYDLAMLARYAMGSEEFRRIAATQWYHLSAPSDYNLYNGNSLLGDYPGADGVKIGWTNRAGWTFVASAVRGGRRLIVTVLDSQDRDADAAALFDWAFGAHHWQTIGAQTVDALAFFQKFGQGASLAPRLTVCY